MLLITTPLVRLCLGETVIVEITDMDSVVMNRIMKLKVTGILIQRSLDNMTQDLEDGYLLIN